jgi:hypothetical protein
MTAFLHYVTKNAPTYKKENPGIAHKDVISRMGGIWKNLSVDEKKVYEQYAENDKKKYDDAKKAYEKTKL